MKLLQEVSRQIRTKIVHPLNDCLRSSKKESANLVKRECRVQHQSADLCSSSSTTSTSTAAATAIANKTLLTQQAINYSNSNSSPKKSSSSTKLLLPQSQSPQLALSRENSLKNRKLTVEFDLLNNKNQNQARSITTTTIIKAMANTPVGNDEALLASARAFIPSLTNAMHKGQAGRIGVIGGSEEYTGAPYFSAIASLKVGADLSHVFCVKNASSVIKSYSPELIVHPLLDSDNAVDEIMEWAPRMHCFVVGPGLGRDPKILQVVGQLIERLKEIEKPMIIDADGLFLVTNNIDLIRNYPKAILTPNSVEFSRLSSAVLGEEVKPAPSASAEKVRELAMTLGYVTILHKGASDVMSNGRLVVCCAGGGSNRRCGGQGDLLAGSLAVLYNWSLAFGDRGDAPAPPELLAAYGACRLTRECARLAYSQNGRSTTTTDLVRLIHQAFSFLFGP